MRLQQRGCFPKDVEHGILWRARACMDVSRHRSVDTCAATSATQKSSRTTPILACCNARHQWTYVSFRQLRTCRRISLLLQCATALNRYAIVCRTAGPAASVIPRRR
jgi:hypothetical protein